MRTHNKCDTWMDKAYYYIRHILLNLYNDWCILDSSNGCDIDGFSLVSVLLRHVNPIYYSYSFLIMRVSVDIYIRTFN